MRIRERARQAAAEADSVVRPAEQLARRAGVHRALARHRRQDSHHRSAQLGRHAEHRIRRQLSVLPAVADVHGAVGRPRLALLRRLRRPHDPRRPQHLVDPGDLERRALPAPSAASTSRAAAPTSAARATCRRRTRRSGSPSCCSRSGSATASSPAGCTTSPTAALASTVQ